VPVCLKLLPIRQQAHRECRGPLTRSILARLSFGHRVSDAVFPAPYFRRQSGFVAPIRPPAQTDHFELNARLGDDR
jgi:hypothetical protein